MPTKEYKEHTGTVIKKHRTILGQYEFTINTGHENIRVTIGKGIYNEYRIGQLLKVGHSGRKLINIRPFQLSEDARIWNQFVDNIVPLDLKEINHVQRNAVIAYCYETEMNSGGHSSFFDSIEGIVTVFDVEQALREIGADIFFSNFVKAYTDGAVNGYSETDDCFIHINPSITDLLREYIIQNRDKIFE